MYSVLITSRAERELRRLDRPIKNRITSALLSLANQPRPHLAQASYIYLFADESSVLQVRARYKSMPGLYLIQYFNSHPSDAPDGLSRQYRLPNEIPVLPPGASETLTLGFSVPINSLLLEDEEPLRLRIHTGDMICDYRFKLAIQEPDPVS